MYQSQAVYDIAQVLRVPTGSVLGIGVVSCSVDGAWKAAEVLVHFQLGDGIPHLTVSVWSLTPMANGPFGRACTAVSYAE